MNDATLHLGFEVGTGAPVAIPIRHLCVTGQTQEAGKTTTLEALVFRANMPAIAFRTKRFERCFEDAPVIPPYFRERADWQFVASILEAALRERMKFQRSWIMKLCQQSKDWRRPQSLADVQKNVVIALKTARGINESVYTELHAYLDLVVPQIEKLPYSSSMALHPGINVMDLGDYTSELQALVIRSVLEWIYQKANNTLVLIPEAWEFIPQKRGSPVKLAAEELIRKGAGGRNYLWIDSQDLAAISTEVRKSVVVWLLGVQRERNEVKRTLEHITGAKKKPTVDDVMQLQRGQFFACFGAELKKVYVQPAWMHADAARRHAMGESDGLVVAAFTRANREHEREEEEKMYKEKYEEAQRTIEQLQARIASLENANRDRDNGGPGPRGLKITSNEPAKEDPTLPARRGTTEPAIYEYILERLKHEAPAMLQVITAKPEIEVRVEREVIRMDGKTREGRIARQIAGGFFDQPQTTATAAAELTRTGFNDAPPNVAKVLADFTRMGFLTRDNKWYRAVDGMKVNIVEA